MFKPSIFKISLGLIIIGTIWIGLTTIESDKISENFTLQIAQTGEYDMYLKGEDVGYYKVTVPNLRDSVFTQILNPQGNIISDKKIETRMTINYFDIKENGIYTLKITNPNERSLEIDLEIGYVNTLELTNPGIILMIGIVLMMFSGYKKLRDYNIAQPEEKIS